MMKTKLITALALASVLPATAFAQTYTFDFDHVPAGSAANAALSRGVTVEPALYAPSVDGDGNDIPGTEAWRVDTLASAVTVDNPLDFDRGVAPSPSNALNALFQPVMLLFPTPEFVANFQVRLDGDDFGMELPVQFYDSDDTLIWSATIDQTIPYFSINALPGVGGVSKIVLPAGAFYDNVVIAQVPEVDSRVLLLGGVAALGAAIRFRRRHS